MKKVFSLLMVAFAMTAMVACSDKDNDNGSDNWVDLGLPSGLLWAKCNLGATAPEEYGDYFAWGETAVKSLYDWSTYRYCNGDSSQMTKYCNDAAYGVAGFTDQLTVLEPGDDAAAVRLGSGARTPTKAEWEELMANTTSEWTTQNGVYGRKLTARNGNSIFLPAAGGWWDADYEGIGEHGGYWSATLCTDSAFCAWDFGIGDDDQDLYAADRKYGLSLRAVRTKNGEKVKMLSCEDVKGELVKM